jgi:catalase
MRVDADTGSKPTYFPNSYHKEVPSTKTTPGFAGQSVVEAPYQVANNVYSRKSYWTDEGTDREYTQVRELYLNRMSEQQRENLHKNTARLLKSADDIVIENYLAQVSGRARSK